MEDGSIASIVLGLTVAVDVKLVTSVIIRGR
jgi:hypothetical protein